MLLTALNNQTSHGSPWLPCVHQSVRDSGVKAMTDSVWSELIHNLPVVFFQITVIWRETHYSECVNGFFFSSLPLNERQKLDDLFSKCSVSTGGLFQLNFAHNTYFVFAREIPGSILDSHHLLSCLINHKHFLYQETDIQFPFPNKSDFYLHYMHA